MVLMDAAPSESSLRRLIEDDGGGGGAAPAAPPQGGGPGGGGGGRPAVDTASSAGSVRGGSQALAGTLSDPAFAEGILRALRSVETRVAWLQAKMGDLDRDVHRIAYKSDMFTASPGSIRHDLRNRAGPSTRRSVQSMAARRPKQAAHDHDAQASLPQPSFRTPPSPCSSVVHPQSDLVATMAESVVVGEERPRTVRDRFRRAIKKLTKEHRESEYRRFVTALKQQEMNGILAGSSRGCKKAGEQSVASSRHVSVTSQYVDSPRTSTAAPNEAALSLSLGSEQQAVLWNQDSGATNDAAAAPPRPGMPTAPSNTSSNSNNYSGNHNNSHGGGNSINTGDSAAAARPAGRTPSAGSAAAEAAPAKGQQGRPVEQHADNDNGAGAARHSIETLEDPEEIEEDRPRDVFLPDSLFRIAWDVCYMVVVYAEFFLWCLVILSSRDGQCSVERTPLVFSLRTAAFCFWFADLWVQMRTAKLDDWVIIEEKPELQHDFLWYRLPFDGIVTLPLDLVVSGLGHELLSYQLMSIKMFRLLRVPKLFAHSTPTRETSNLIESIAFAFWFLVAMHLCACIWLRAASIEEQSLTEEEWEDLYHVYVKAYYFTWTTISSVGYGDISPKTSGMRIYNIFMQLLGVAIVMLVSGRTGAYFITTDPYKLVHIERKRRLEHLMANAGIPWSVQKEAFTIYPSLLDANTKDY
eukprot:gene16746-25709_t